MTKRRHKDSDQTTGEDALQEDAIRADDEIRTAAEEEGFMGPDAADAADAVDTTEAPLSPEAVLTAERDDFQEKWLRALAEMENLRKRTRREVTDARRFAQADALRPFLDVFDNLERALQSTTADADTAQPDPFRDGIELIRQKFRGVLTDQGVEQIEAIGQHFDPAIHEVVGQLPREGVEPGTVIEVAQAGFRQGDLVLRPVRVIICA